MACDDPACGGCTGRIKNTVTTLPPELRRKVNAWYFASLRPAGDPPVIYHEDAAEEAKFVDCPILRQTQARQQSPLSSVR